MSETLDKQDIQVDNTEKLNDLKSHLTPEEQVKALQEYLDNKKDKDSKANDTSEYSKKAINMEAEDPEEFDSSDPIHDKELKEVLRRVDLAWNSGYEDKKSPLERADPDWNSDYGDKKTPLERAGFNGDFNYDLEGNPTKNTETQVLTEIEVMERIKELQNKYKLTLSEITLLKDMNFNNVGEDNWMGIEDKETHHNMKIKYGEQIFRLDNRGRLNALNPYNENNVKIAEKIIQIKNKYNLTPVESEHLKALHIYDIGRDNTGTELSETHHNMKIKYGEQIFRLKKEED